MTSDMPNEIPGLNNMPDAFLETVFDYATEGPFKHFELLCNIVPVCKRWMILCREKKALWTDAEGVLCNLYTKIGKPDSTITTLHYPYVCCADDNAVRIYRRDLHESFAMFLAQCEALDTMRLECAEDTWPVLYACPKPVNLTVTMALNTPTDMSTHLRTVLSPRLRVLRVFIDAYGDDPNCHDYLDPVEMCEMCPNLHTLVFARDAPYSDVMLQLDSLSESSEFLRKLYLRSSFLTVSRPDFEPCLQNLVELEITECEVDTVALWQILVSLEFLTKLHVSSTRVGDLHDPNTGRNRFGSLRALRRLVLTSHCDSWRLGDFAELWPTWRHTMDYICLGNGRPLDPVDSDLLDTLITDCAFDVQHAHDDDRSFYVEIQRK